MHPRQFIIQTALDHDLSSLENFRATQARGRKRVLTSQLTTGAR